MRKELFDQFTAVGIGSDGVTISFIKDKESLHYGSEYEIITFMDKEYPIRPLSTLIENPDEVEISEWADKALTSYLDKGWGFQRELPDGVFWVIPESEKAGVLFLADREFHIDYIKQSRKASKRDRKSNKYSHETW